MTDKAITTLAARIGVRAACGAVGAAQAGYYRRHRRSTAPPRAAPTPHRERRQPRALSTAEQDAVLDVLHCERFADLAPAEVWAILLDEGVYLGSQSTSYRLLRRAGEVRERRAQATHPAKVKPELAATAPNAVWSWDITNLRGPAKWTYYQLHVILDIDSRYVVGWMVASRESAVLAEVLIKLNRPGSGGGSDSARRLLGCLHQGSTTGRPAPERCGCIRTGSATVVSHGGRPPSGRGGTGHQPGHAAELDRAGGGRQWCSCGGDE